MKAHGHDSAMIAVNPALPEDVGGPRAPQACAAGDVDDPGLLEERLERALREHEIELAGDYATRLAALRWGRDVPANNSPTLCGRDPVEQARFLTLPKLVHDVEQLSHLRDRELVGREITSAVAAYEDLIRQMSSGRLQEPALLSDEVRARIGHVYNRLIYLRPTPRVSRALSAAWDSDQAEADYLDSESGVVVVDDFLSEEALGEVRRFCLESTVWSANRYNHGRLGAFFRDGFNCPLLLQIAEELRDALPRAIGRRYPLQQLWGFKTGQTLPADSTTHADFAAVNVNFWVTPTDANLDQGSGGMVIYDVQAPIDWDFNAYNGKLNRIKSYLIEKKARAIRIPYKQNRAIIFNSDLFHGTEAVHFRPGYENRRINVTMLYGYRHADAHHLDNRRDHAHSLARIGPPAWRSAAFAR
jgi:hypothetical protein